MMRGTTGLRQRVAEVQVALGLLTRLRAGRLADPVPTIADAAWAFPLAGLVVGALTAGAFLVASMIGLPPQIAAGVSLAAGVLATGGLHEDGLADTADGFGGGRTRAHKLEIMRDSRIGSYGTMALILAFGLRWSAVSMLGNTDRLAAAAVIVAIAVASRAALAAVLAWLPPARADGLGHAAARPGAARAVVALSIGLLALGTLVPPPAAVVIALAGGGVVMVLARLAVRQIGGQTGDVLGAMQQAADICAWLALLALSH